MPEMDGPETARRIRALDLPGGRPGLVAFSSQVKPEHRALCLEAGMQAFLAKPFSQEELRAALEEASAGRAPGRDAVRGAPRRIILVDDDAAVRGFVRDALSIAGFEVTQVASGEDARVLVEAESRPYDLLIADVVMPGMGGPEFGRWLQGVRPATKVLYISGYGEETARMFGLPPGRFEFLPKPFGPSDLLEKVTAVLGDGPSPPGRA